MGLKVPDHTSAPMLVEMKNDQPVTTSLKVAQVFGKRHANILRDIENINCSPEFAELNFEFSSYTDSTGRKLPCYDITRDGFVFLAMGFTGAEAGRWKERYIEAFNMMEKRLTKQIAPISPTAQLRLQLEALEALEAKQEITSSRVEAIEHKLETNGCRPGFLPITKAHAKFGQVVSEAMFRLIIERFGVETDYYTYAIPDSGQLATGMSVNVEEMKHTLAGFIRSVERETEHLWINPALGYGKRFKFNTFAANKFMREMEGNA